MLSLPLYLEKPLSVKEALKSESDFSAVWFIDDSAELICMYVSELVMFNTCKCLSLVGK